MKLIKNTIIYTAVTVLKNGLGVFLIPLYTAYLTTKDYGILSIVTSISQLLGIVILLSLGGAGMRYHYEFKGMPEKQRRLWGTVYAAVFINGILIVLIVTAAKGVLFETWIGDIPFFPYVAIGIAAAFFFSGYQLFQTYLKADQQGKRSGTIEISYFLLNLSLTVFFVVALNLKALGVLLSLLISNGIFSIASFVMFRKKISLGIDKGHLRTALRYSLPLLPHALAGWIMTLTDRIFLNSMTSTSEVGVYTIGFQFANVLHVFMVAINQAYSPWFFEQTTKGKEGLKKIIRFSELFVLFFSVLGLFFSLFTSEVLQLFASKDYQAGWVVTPFLAFAFVSRSIYYMVVGPVFLKKTSLVPIITFTGALLNVGLNALLIGRYGKIGASVASLITMFVTSILALIMSRRVENFGYRWPQMYFYVVAGFALSLLAFLRDTLGDVKVLILKVAVMLAVVALLYFRYATEIRQFYAVIFKKGAKKGHGKHGA